MVHIKIGEGLLKVTLCYDVFSLEAGHYEFGQVDVARTVGVDHSHQ